MPGDPRDVRIKDGHRVTIAFVPKGTKVPDPPSLANLRDPNANEPGASTSTTLPAGTTETTPPGGTTATTAPPATTASTAPPASTTPTTAPK